MVRTLDGCITTIKKGWLDLKPLALSKARAFSFALNRQGAIEFSPPSPPPFALRANFPTNINQDDKISLNQDKNSVLA